MDRRRWTWRLVTGSGAAVAGVLLAAVVALRPATSLQEPDATPEAPRLPPPVQPETPGRTPGTAVTPVPESSVVPAPQPVRPVQPVRPNTRTRAS